MLEAIDLLAERHMQPGKKLQLRHLSLDCLELPDKARGMMEVNVLEDPLTFLEGECSRVYVTLCFY